MASTYGYTTDANVKAVEPLLGDIYSTSGALDDYISRAERQINSDLSAMYSVPFTGTIPDAVINLAITLTAYYAYRAKFSRDSQNKNEWVDGFMDEYDKMTKAILSRQMNLTDSAGDVSARAEGVEASREDYTPVFDVDDDLNHAIDSDLLDDIDEDRT